VYAEATASVCSTVHDCHCATTNAAEMTSESAAGGSISRYALPLRSGDSVVLADSAPEAVAPLILALPGWKGSDLGLRALMDPVVRCGYRVVTLNYPGMGMVPIAAGRRYDMRRLIDIVDEVIEFLVPSTPSLILVGHSFGATLATAVAGRRSHALHGLVLVSPVVVPLSRRRGVSGRLSLMITEASTALLRSLPNSWGQRLVRSQPVDVLATATLARHGLAGFHRIRAASQRERWLVPDIDALVDQLRAATHHACLESATTTGLITWIIAGTADAMSSVADLEQLRAALGARLELLSGAGHLAHHEDVSSVSRLLVAAIDEICQ
jgi:pimeloyl-ACP methyl ester carboxylesterase